MVDEDPLEYERAKRYFVTMVRNEYLWKLVETIRDVEDGFNRKYHYDWVFMTDGDFDDEFKKLTSAITPGSTVYAKIPQDHWTGIPWAPEASW